MRSGDVAVCAGATRASSMDLLSPGLRPELLRSLLAQLPLAGAVAASSVDHVRAALETHALLAEVVPESAAAVDAFVERLLALSSSQQARAQRTLAQLLRAAANSI